MMLNSGGNRGGRRLTPDHGPARADGRSGVISSVAAMRRRRRTLLVGILLVLALVVVVLVDSTPQSFVPDAAGQPE